MVQFIPVFNTVIIILLSAVFMLVNPRETVLAASAGLHLWYSTVVPALLPFFIVAEILVQIRFVNFLGILLEPVMRPLFRLPGCSALVVVMGFTSGFPVGAILTKQLYEQKMLTRDEAERLLVFTNNASPLFILGAVGVGMFASPAAGYLLAFAHYLSNLLVGLLWRFRGEPGQRAKDAGVSNLSLAWQTMMPTPKKPLAGPGKLLGDAIRNSINNVMAVGGFILVFSVLTRMLSVWGLIDGMSCLLLKFLGNTGLGYNQVYGLCMGIFEMTIGCRTASSTSAGPILPLLIVVSAILSFSGLSIIAQIMSIMAGITIRWRFYFLSRLIQVALSCVITFGAYHAALAWGMLSLPAAALPFYKVLYDFNAWSLSIGCLAAAGVLLLVLSLAAFIRAKAN